ncbi:hypothetical protein HRbin15_02369 [bacterium HR15]|nr:hypothetical protein HRbin15_02369 [bacterium HR15]
MRAMEVRVSVSLHHLGGVRIIIALGALVLLFSSACPQQPVLGRSDDPGTPAVRGQHAGNSGVAGQFSILRSNNPSNALEVFTAGMGVAGFFRIANPNNAKAALFGEAPTLAIFGVATATNGFTYGGRFENASTSGRGVLGWATASTGQTIGVYGRSASTQGIGVYGLNTASTGTTYGVYGENSSRQGVGVFGIATATTGTTYAVRGKVNSPNGFAGYFEGRGYFAGNVGIGTANPTAALHVVGGTLLSGNATIGGALTVSGATSLGSTLDVSGATTLNNTLNVSGATTLSNTLNVSGATTLNNTLRVNGSAEVRPNTDVESLLVRQTTAAAPTADIFAVSNADATTKFLWVDATGTVHIPALNTGGSSTGNQVISGDLTVQGNTILGDADTDTVAINGHFTTSLLPRADNSVDLGSGTLRWRHLFLAGNATIGGALTVSGATSLGSTLDVSGATTLNNTLNVSGATTLSNTLNVSGATTLNNTLRVNGSAEVRPNTDVESLLVRQTTAAAPTADIFAVSNADATTKFLWVDATGTVHVHGDLSVGGNLNGNAGGDLGGTYPNPTVVGLQTRPVSNAAPASGQVLKWDGSQWLPAPDNDTTYSAGAGLQLIGTTFSIATSGVVTSMLADLSVTTSKIDDGAVNDAKLSTTGVAAGTYGSATQVPQLTVNEQGRITAVSNVSISGVPPGGTAGGDLGGTYPNPTVVGLQTRPVSNTAPASGQVLKWNSASSQWEPATDNDTTYSAGSGLSLVGTTFSVATGGITTAMLADSAVTTLKIANDSVTSDKLSFPLQRSLAHANSLLDLTNTGTGGTGRFQINNATSTGTALEASTNGTGAALSVSAPVSGTALAIDGGALRVVGAGVGTNTTVFIHQETTGGVNATEINHPLINGDPTAILIVTYNETGSGTSITLPAGGYGVRYNSTTSRWEIYLLDSTQTIPANATFNVMIVKP